jgi:tetratricopeptide (TPR) repeat protein
VVAVAVVALAAGIVGGLLLRARQSRRLTEKDTIVLGDFANSTGDAVLDGALREGLSVELEQSPFLSLLAEEGIHRTLRMMERPVDARLTPEITREVCQRTSSAATLGGSIALIGTRYNLILKAINCVTGELLASTEAQANDKSHVLDALGKAALEMRRRLGESLSTVQKYNTPLEQATTPSLEALQAYNLGWQAFFGQGDTAAAVSFFQRAAHLDPNFAMAYWGMGQSYSFLGESTLADESGQKAYELRERLSELEKLKIECDDTPGEIMKAMRSCELGEKTYPRDALFHWDLALYSDQLGRTPGVEDLLLAEDADTAAYFGHHGKARELSRRAADSAELAAGKETAGGYYGVSALREALLGDPANARQQATIAKKRSTGRDLDYGVALALAYAGDANRAQALTDDLGKRFPEDTTLQFNYLPTLRAKLALLHSNPQRALDILRVAAPYELGLPAVGIYNWPNLYPVYVRGEAYLAAHRGSEAAAEFRKILDHRGIVSNEPIGVLAHLQLGRAYAMQGDTAKARVSYNDFLVLWKEADPDIPILRQAKSEYGKLQSLLAVETSH